MTLNEKIITYKVLDLVILYNVDTNLDFIRGHIKKLRFFLHGTICRGRLMLSPALKNVFLGMGDAITLP